MQMWTSGSTAASDAPDDFSLVDGCAHVDKNFAQMSITGNQTIPMVDFHHPAVPAIPTRFDNYALSGCLHRGSKGSSKVNSGMMCQTAKDRILSGPEIACASRTRKWVCNR